MQDFVIPALRSALLEPLLPRNQARLLAAVSGGADSVALLLGLALLQPELDFSLFAVHVHHGLREASAQEDADFVAELCGRLQVPLLLYHAKLAGGMNSPGAEERAREARRSFFEKAMKEVAAHALLTAHHQDDQAETVLMRLLRGAGAGGLGGMRRLLPLGTGVLLRPFLDLSHETLRQALSSMHQPWREDESNQSPCCLRNHLRLSVFPLLEPWQPQAARHMAQAAQRLQWDEDCLSALAQELLQSAHMPWPDVYALRRQPLASAPKAVALRALRRWVEDGLSLYGKRSGKERSLSHADSLRLYDLALSGEKKAALNLPWDLQTTATADFLCLHWQDGRSLLPKPDLFPLWVHASMNERRFGGLLFSLSSLTPKDALPDGRHAVLLPHGLLSQGLSLRPPQGEDRMRPFGAKGGKALRRYFTDHKVGADFRSAWPVLALGREVLWVPGLGASEQTRRLPGDPEPLWKLTCHGALPLVEKQVE